MTALYFLGKHVSFEYEPKKGELQDMIWEVDESMDGTVSYLEFSLMYRRVSLLLVRNSHVLARVDLTMRSCHHEKEYRHGDNHLHTLAKDASRASPAHMHPRMRIRTQTPHHTTHTDTYAHTHTHSHSLSLSLSLSLHLPTRSGRWIRWDSNPESCS